MRITNRTLKRLIVLTGLVLLCGGLTASSCVQDRHIDIVAGGEIVVPFVAHGSDNTWNDSAEIDLGSAAGIDSILSDNGFEPGSVRAAIESIAYRVTQQDPETSRRITGAISVSNGGAPAELVQFTSVLVDSTTDWVPLPLTSEGTALLNSALAAILDHNTPETITFSSQGTSTPVDVPTHFTWQARLKLSVVGTKKITVFQPL
jgi:hypothetical protein